MHKVRSLFMVMILFLSCNSSLVSSNYHQSKLLLDDKKAQLHKLDQKGNGNLTDFEKCVYRALYDKIHILEKSIAGMEEARFDSPKTALVGAIKRDGGWFGK